MPIPLFRSEIHLLKGRVAKEYAVKSWQFFFLGLYQIPEDLKRANIIEEVTNLNSVPHPEGMGLSENSATVRDLRDSKRLLHGILLTQPGVAELVNILRNLV